RRLSSARHLRRANSQRRKACRSACPAGDRVRDGGQPQSRQSPRRDDTDGDPAARRRGHRMSANIQRRAFITLLGAAAAWPLIAPAQQIDKVRRIGVLQSLAVDDPEALGRVTAFAQGLAELGWIVGRNVRIEYRWGAGDLDRFRRYAAELVALAPD